MVRRHIQRNFLNKKLSTLARKAGYNQTPIFAHFNNGHFELGEPEHYAVNHKVEMYAPLYQQILDWLRKKHKMPILPVGTHTIDKYHFSILINDLQWQLIKNEFGSPKYFEYYQGLNKAIEEALKIVIKKKENETKK